MISIPVPRRPAAAEAATAGDRAHAAIAGDTGHAGEHDHRARAGHDGSFGPKKMMVVDASDGKGPVFASSGPPEPPGAAIRCGLPGTSVSTTAGTQAAHHRRVPVIGSAKSLMGDGGQRAAGSRFCHMPY